MLNLKKTANNKVLSLKNMYKHKMLTISFRYKKLTNIFKFGKKKVVLENNIVKLPVNDFIPSLMDKTIILDETINLNNYFKTAMNEGLIKEVKDNKKVVEMKEEPLKYSDMKKEEIKERYDKFIKYMRENSDSTGKVFVSNIEIINNLDLTNKKLINLKQDGVRLGDLIVKNQKTYVNIEKV